MNCNSCGKCTRNCEFLKKYDMDFSDENMIEHLAFHCMLCNKCTEICPFGVDGRELVLEARRNSVERNQGKLQGYNGLQYEKINYKFKNYKKAKRSVLFPGCNYPSLFPKTTKKVIDLMAAYDIGVVFDCCGKPISELGLGKAEKEIIHKLNERLKKEGIDEIIILCPNCFYFLEGKLEIQITSIYKKMQDLGIGKVLEKDEVLYIFPPCPDREKQKLLNDIESFLPKKNKIVNAIQCCGLGGVAAAKEKEFPSIMANALKQYKEKNDIKDIYVYCASCAGSFEKNKVNNVCHLLNEILCSKEKPDTKKSFINRMRIKFT